MLEAMFNKVSRQNGLMHTVNPYTYETLQEAYRTLDEFPEMNEDTSALLSITGTYSGMLFNELLDNVRAFLLEFYQKVLMLFNNYILNYVHVFNKYEILITDRFYQLKMPLRYRTYSYPKLYEYPKDIHKGTLAEDAALEIIHMAKNPKYQVGDVDRFVDKKIQQFSYEVIGSRVDPFNISDSTKKFSYDVMQGNEVVETLTRDDISKFIKQIRNYSKTKKEISDLKYEIEDYYENLKRGFKKMYKKSTSLETEYENLAKAYDPEAAVILDRQANRNSLINIQLSRLFNGFVTIYSAAFTAKLEILQQQVNIGKTVLTELMVRTNVFYGVDGKSVDPRKKAKYDRTSEIIL